MADGGWSTAGVVSAFVLDSRWGIGRGFETYHDDFELEQGEKSNLGAVQRDGPARRGELCREAVEGGAGVKMHRRSRVLPDVRPASSSQRGRDPCL